MRYAAVVGLIAPLVAGCGGSSARSTVTVTASTAGKTATTGTTPTPNQAFAAFLARVQPIRKKSNDMLDRCDRLEQKVNSLDPTFSGWAAAAQCTRREAKLDKQAADTLATIVPPKQLRHPYLAYVRSYRTDGRIESGLPTSAVLTKSLLSTLHPLLESELALRSRALRWGSR